MKWRYSDRFSSLPALVLEVEIVATGTDRLRRVPAKIDTGSDITVIPTFLVAELKLIVFCERLLHAVGHPAYRMHDVFRDDCRGVPLFRHRNGNAGPAIRFAWS